MAKTKNEDLKNINKKEFDALMQKILSVPPPPKDKSKQPLKKKK